VFHDLHLHIYASHHCQVLKFAREFGITHFLLSLFTEAEIPTVSILNLLNQFSVVHDHLSVTIHNRKSGQIVLKYGHINLSLADIVVTILLEPLEFRAVS
jgi:hypothetical protein